MNAAIRQLAAEVRSAQLSRHEVEGLVLNLSPQQRRVYLRLRRGPADTEELRAACQVGNVSAIVAAINAKLAAVGERRRIVCETRRRRDQFGERGIVGTWRLVSESRQAA